MDKKFKKFSDNNLYEKGGRRRDKKGESCVFQQISN